jgi:Protein of unknown function (DUF3592)
MVALYIILFWILLAIVILTRYYYSKDMKMTSAATGAVVSAENREIRDGHGRRDETVVTCQFSVGGKDYRVVKVYRGRNAKRYPAGRKINVRYNPADPGMARVPG